MAERARFLAAAASDGVASSAFRPRLRRTTSIDFDPDAVRQPPLGSSPDPVQNVGEAPLRGFGGHHQAGLRAGDTPCPGRCARSAGEFVAAPRRLGSYAPRIPFWPLGRVHPPSRARAPTDHDRRARGCLCETSASITVANLVTVAVPSSCGRNRGRSDSHVPDLSPVACGSALPSQRRRAA
jgi:hypothetical protein